MTTRYASVATDAIEMTINRLDSLESELRSQRRALEIALDEERLRMRPLMPTPEMLLGIRNAIAKIEANALTKDHHGECSIAGEYLVRHRVPGGIATGNHDGWIGINDGAPFEAGRSGRKIWRFSDEEIEVMVKACEVSGSFIVTKWWQHGDGVAIVVDRRQA